MDGLAASCFIGRFVPFPSARTRCNRRRHGFLALASSSPRDEPELDKWDHMELKFGRLIGEDPKLTLAKIKGRKLNPEMSYLDIEKSVAKKKGKSNSETVEVPLDWSDQKGERSNSEVDTCFPNKNLSGEKNLNLVRPVMKKGIKAEEIANDVPIFTKRKPSQLSQKIDTKSSGVSDITLRKPSALQADDIGVEKSSKLEIKPNLYLKMRKNLYRSSSDMSPLKKPKDLSDNFSDVTLLKKPEPVSISSNPNEERSPDSVRSSSGDVNMGTVGVELSDPSGKSSTNILSCEKRTQLDIGLQRPVFSDSGNPEKKAAATQSFDLNSVRPSSNSPTQSALQGKPERLDQLTTQRSDLDGAEKTDLNDGIHDVDDEVKHFQSTALGEHEVSDWARAEDLLQTGGREEVELISCSSRGFVVYLTSTSLGKSSDDGGGGGSFLMSKLLIRSARRGSDHNQRPLLVSFGSLIGFLPYRNLGAKWKFLAFESWLRKKGLDPSLYKQHLSILGSYEVQKRNLELESNRSPETNQRQGENPAADMKLEDLLETYDQEKTKFLSSFVGQRIKVSVILADRNSRKLMFSGRPKESQEIIEKKRSLMGKLSIGDAVKCYIKKISYFGIFVEIEGVPALIHQSEVSWDATLDPSTYFKIGQIVEAKVHQLDFALERISLSLKQITPDPLIEALESLESVVGDHSSLGGSPETLQMDVEWADVESLIKELQQIEGVDRVSKGRFFLSPGLAPTFQVYMASVFDNQYKLLARSGNKVQEVIVQASLDREQMKAVILTCTNRVE